MGSSEAGRTDGATLEESPEAGQTGGQVWGRRQDCSGWWRGPEWMTSDRRGWTDSRRSKEPDVIRGWQLEN